MKKKCTYMGLTYPACFRSKAIHWLWKRLNCRRNMHLWDEVWDIDNHYLVCDACGKEVGIDDGWKFVF